MEYDLARERNNYWLNASPAAAQASPYDSRSTFDYSEMNPDIASFLEPVIPDLYKSLPLPKDFHVQENNEDSFTLRINNLKIDDLSDNLLESPRVMTFDQLVSGSVHSKLPELSLAGMNQNFSIQPMSNDFEEMVSQQLYLDIPAHPSSAYVEEKDHSLHGSADNPSSCHNCKRRRPGEDLRCCNNIKKKETSNRSCKKKYCLWCLQKYGISVEDAKMPGWICASCQGICDCAACRRKFNNAA
jgi:hypothetical protein